MSSEVVVLLTDTPFFLTKNRKIFLLMNRKVKKRKMSLTLMSLKKNQKVKKSL